jgi:CubicO group peptidase (beta-lactamase class C family)
MMLLRILGKAAIAIVALIALVLVAAVVAYPPEYVYRVLVWQESDAFDWQKFPSHPLTASPAPVYFEAAPDPRVESVFEEVSGQPDWNSFLEAQHTQAFIVMQDGAIKYERYFNGTRRDSVVTSFSVAKSFASALIGIAIDEGRIGSVNDPITLYLPELEARDPRFSQITIRDLLLMSSGLDFQEMRPLLLNGDDPLTTYFPDQRAIALNNTHILEAPGQHFSYNKYHPQLLGMILERATGMPVTTYMQGRLWDPLGMEFAGSWSTDSVTSDFEKMETGVNARAIDFLKLGALYLKGGTWNGGQVVSRDWVEESTSPLLPQDYADYYDDFVKSMPGRGYYKYMWWGMEHDDGTYDFTAEGDKGQYIYVSPGRNMVIVRNGVEYGIPSHAWLALFYEFAERY